MSAGLDDVLEATRVREQRRAARALLRRPLLRAHGPGSEDFPLVRRHAGMLRGWFDRNTGWRLTVDTEGARLAKQAPSTSDPTHPARDPRSGVPFGRRRYVLVCLALAVLERAEAQITLGQLAEGVILAAADEDLVRAGVEFRLEGREERGDLVAVVRLLLSLGVIARVAGDEDSYVRDAGDALYDVERRALAGVLAAPRGPSTIDAATFDERFAALADVPTGHTDELRNRALRHHLTSRLLDDPVLYYDTLTPEELAYLNGQRAAILRRITDLTGLVPEVRAEGIAMVDPDDDLTDVRMPETGTDGHVALLLAGHLAETSSEADATPIPLSELERLTRGWAREHRAYWRKAATAPGAEAELVADAVRRLEALSLVTRVDDGVRPRPALARYAVDTPTLLDRIGTGQ